MSKLAYFNTASIHNINEATKALSKTLEASPLGLTSPLFELFIGSDAVGLTVSKTKQSYFVEKENGDITTIPFASKGGKNITTVLTVVLPECSKNYANSAEYKELQAMGLRNYLTAKANAARAKKDVQVLIPYLPTTDVYAAEKDEDGRLIVLGKISEMSEEIQEELLFEAVEQDGELVTVLRKNLVAVLAKDMEITHANQSVHSLYQRQRNSLHYTRDALERGIKVQTIQMKKSSHVSGKPIELVEDVRALVLDHQCIFDDKRPVSENELYNQLLTAFILDQVHVINKQDGNFGIHEDITDVDLNPFEGFLRSVAQKRAGGTNGFDSLESIVQFFKGTGQDHISYGKQWVQVDADGVSHATAYGVVDVAKASKRYWLGGSNGKAPKSGLLSRFGKGHIKSIEVSEKVIGEIKVRIIKLTNDQNEVYTLGVTNKDFYSVAQNNQPFLCSVLNEDLSLKEIAEFKNWSDSNAASILVKNLTDGSGDVDALTVKELRKGSALNSFDAFQLRATNSAKGAVKQNSPMCELFGVNMLLTDGMVKAEKFVEDIRRNGFQVFVVGQRKDGADGSWIASQALQQMGLTLEELKAAVETTIEYFQNSVEGKSAARLLAAMDAAEEEDGKELNVTNFVRLAKEYHTNVLDDQFMTNELKATTVKELNKLLDAKVYVQDARARYMFTDPIAIYNAAKRGSYLVTAEDAVLQSYEVVAPSKNSDGTFFMKTGRAQATRFPFAVHHEGPIVTGVAPKEYEKAIHAGLWQGCVFFDIFSWVAPQMSGADFDGDFCILIFDSMIVAACLRLQKKAFGGRPVLPLIDVWAVLDKDGRIKTRTRKDGKVIPLVGSGCPDFKDPDAPEREEDKIIEMDGFRVLGNQIIFDPKQMDDQNIDRFLRLQAKLLKKMTINTFERSLIGVIANRVMNLTDMLTRDLKLSAAEREEVEYAMMLLCVAGRWEIDRPKHGGAYLAMPIFKRLFEKFDKLKLSKQDILLSDDQKFQMLEDKKGIFHHLFAPVYKKNVITQFKVKKPQWLASQKDEWGVKRSDSLFEQVFGNQVNANQPKSISELALEQLCTTFAEGHNNTAKNTISRELVVNMGISPEQLQWVESSVERIYDQYVGLEERRREAASEFKAMKKQELENQGVFGYKNMDSLTSAKIAAKVRSVYKQDLAQFATDEEVLKSLLRKEIYEEAKVLGYDVRILVGALYNVVYARKGKGKVAYGKDGREYRFLASNGYITLPFGVFSEEMQSLISGPVHETFFFPMDLGFTLIRGHLIDRLQMKARVLQPNLQVAGQCRVVRRPVAIAIRHEDFKGTMRSVMYFLKKDVQLQDVANVTKEDAAYIGFAPTNANEGVFMMNIRTIEFNAEADVATIRFQ